jgi:hypothetical protein
MTLGRPCPVTFASSSWYCSQPEAGTISLERALLSFSFRPRKGHSVLAFEPQHAPGLLGGCHLQRQFVEDAANLQHLFGAGGGKICRLASRSIEGNG